MKEILQSFYDSSTERIKSPLVGSYLTAFLIYNWRPIFIVLFSDAKIECKIEVINTTYCDKSALVWPLIIALFYTLIIPRINSIIEKLLFGDTRSKSIRKHESKLFILNQKKVEVKVERELEDIRAGLQDMVNLNNQIEQLKGEKQKLIDDLQAAAEKSNEAKTFQDSRSAFSEALDLYDSFSPKQLDQFVNVCEILMSNKVIIKEIEDLLQTYIMKGLVQKLTSNQNTVLYEITNTGLALYNLIQRKKF